MVSELGHTFGHPVLEEDLLRTAHIRYAVGHRAGFPAPFPKSFTCRGQRRMPWILNVHEMRRQRPEILDSVFEIRLDPGIVSGTRCTKVQILDNVSQIGADRGHQEIEHYRHIVRDLWSRAAHLGQAFDTRCQSLTASGGKSR